MSIWKGTKTIVTDVLWIEYQRPGSCRARRFYLTYKDLDAIVRSDRHYAPIPLPCVRGVDARTVHAALVAEGLVGPQSYAGVVYATAKLQNLMDGW